jgi:hypothetical protein
LKAALKIAGDSECRIGAPITPARRVVPLITTTET